VLATGISGHRRLRYGPTRDHVLEVTIVTGDGRLVRAGARVVKHVQGYDLMRLACGSLGSVGIVVEACLKLWPEPPALATVAVPDPTAALATAFRPQAVLETPDGGTVMLAGTPEEVAAQAADLGGEPIGGHRWPEMPAVDGERGRWSIRVPAPSVPDVVAALPPGAAFVAEHGVGVVTAALAGPDAAELRSRAERLGGSVVLLDGPDHLYADPGPWGADPPALGLQRRIVARFDPDRVLNPGRPAGGL
jgi:glycolate oxidase FAD binding subunit